MTAISNEAEKATAFGIYVVRAVGEIEMRSWKESSNSKTTMERASALDYYYFYAWKAKRISELLASELPHMFARSPTSSSYKHQPHLQQRVSTPNTLLFNKLACSHESESSSFFRYLLISCLSTDHLVVDHESEVEEEARSTPQA